MKLSRRKFLQASALGSVAAMAPPLALAAGGVQSNCIVQVFLRGGSDGPQVLVPYTDSNYYTLRPTIAIPPPGQSGGCLDLNGKYGLHPSLGQRFADLFKTTGGKKLSFVCGADLAMPVPDLSHFSKQARVEQADINKPSNIGWLNTHLSHVVPTWIGEPPTFLGTSLGSGMAYSMRGPFKTIGMKSPSDFTFKATTPRNKNGILDMEDAFDDIYVDDGSALGTTALQARSAVDELLAYNLSSYATVGDYPNTDLGLSLKDAAQMIMAGTGVKVLTVNQLGHDSHHDASTKISDLMLDLGQSLVAFNDDMVASGNSNNVTILVISEFGRRQAQNGSVGTDHGQAGNVMMIGGGVVGGKVYGDYDFSNAFLANGSADSTANMPMNWDIRSVMHELLSMRTSNTNVGACFAGFVKTETIGCFKDYRTQ